MAIPKLLLLISRTDVLSMKTTPGVKSDLLSAKHESDNDTFAFSRTTIAPAYRKRIIF